jgi:hypothetical protein|tara:strand:- start:56 stop:238 length:183 start_codon:yes stop_codon:yes gene_type:complete
MKGIRWATVSRSTPNVALGYDGVAAAFSDPALTLTPPIKSRIAHKSPERLHRAHEHGFAF